MNTADPFQFLFDLLGAARDKLGPPRLPDWLSHELSNRLLLVINHLLQQHPQARERLLKHKDQVLHVQWNNWILHLKITPAGLFELADEAQREHLHVQVEEPGTMQLLHHAVTGQRPQVHITGDPQLADTINWLADHVHWNGEADLARLIGSDAARHVARALRHARTALHNFVTAVVPTSSHNTVNTHTPDTRAHACTPNVPPATNRQSE